MTHQNSVSKFNDLPPNIMEALRNFTQSECLKKKLTKTCKTHCSHWMDTVYPAQHKTIFINDIPFNPRNFTLHWKVQSEGSNKIYNWNQKKRVCKLLEEDTTLRLYIEIHIKTPENLPLLNCVQVQDFKNVWPEKEWLRMNNEHVLSLQKELT
jgi:hypothetical protein